MARSLPLGMWLPISGVSAVGSVHCVWAILALLCVLYPSQVQAQSALNTCLTIRSAKADDAAFERLVRSEVDRHPSHRIGSPPCASELEVEKIEVGGTSYLTGRLVGQVPHRVAVEEHRVDRALVELLRVVLGNDPLQLRDPKESEWFGQALFGLRHRAHTLWGAELSQRVAWLKGHAFSLPQLSMHYRRELDRWQLGIRLDVAAHIAQQEPNLHPTWTASLVPELSWFSSASADVAAYGTLGVGLHHQRFQGPLPNAPGAQGRAAATGLLVALRAGTELFRTTDTRVRIFADVDLPLFVAKDVHQHVIHSWMPTLGIGTGISF